MDAESGSVASRCFADSLSEIYSCVTFVVYKVILYV